MAKIPLSESACARARLEVGVDVDLACGCWLGIILAVGRGKVESGKCADGGAGRSQRQPIAPRQGWAGPSGRSEEGKPTLPERAEMGRHARRPGRRTRDRIDGAWPRTPRSAGGQEAVISMPCARGRARPGAVETGGRQRGPQCGRVRRPGSPPRPGSRRSRRPSGRSGPSPPGRRPARAPGRRDRRCSGPPGERNKAGGRLRGSSPTSRSRRLM